MDSLEKLLLKQTKQYHKETYIDYRKEAIISKLNKQDLLDKLDWLIENDYQFIKATTLRKSVPTKSYSLTYDDHLIKLSYFDGHNHYFCPTNYHDDTKNIDTPNSFKSFKSDFKKRVGITLLQSFGRVKQDFKLFCPKPLYYINRTYYIGVRYSNICKEDYNSHYPAAAMGMLPDANTSLEVEGNVLPSKEYPFAFYPDSGNVAVYGEFDSRNYTSFVLTYSANVKKTKYTPNYKAEDNHTILMKASANDLKNEILHYYKIKSEAPKDSVEYHNAKIFLLKFIGMMEQCSPIIYKSYPFAHLAAIIKWRANIKMFNTIKKIGKDNVIQICVDGIIHKGQPIGSNSNEIGSLNTYLVNAKFVQRGINQYILKNESMEERKHAGLDINTDSDNIMNWLASPKVDFINYVKDNYLIQEKTHEKKI